MIEVFDGFPTESFAGAFILELNDEALVGQRDIADGVPRNGIELVLEIDQRGGAFGRNEMIPSEVAHVRTMPPGVNHHLAVDEMTGSVHGMVVIAMIVALKLGAG